MKKMSMTAVLCLTSAVLLCSSDNSYAMQDDERLQSMELLLPVKSESKLKVTDDTRGEAIAIVSRFKNEKDLIKWLDGQKFSMTEKFANNLFYFADYRRKARDVSKAMQRYRKKKGNNGYELGDLLTQAYLFANNAPFGNKSRFELIQNVMLESLNKFPLKDKQTEETSACGYDKDAVLEICRNVSSQIDVERAHGSVSKYTHKMLLDLEKFRDEYYEQSGMKKLLSETTMTSTELLIAVLSSEKNK